MQIKNQLVLIITILISELVLSTFEVLGLTVPTELGKDVLYVILRLFDITILLYLFYYVSVNKKQKFSFLALSLIILTTLFALFDHFFEFREIDSTVVTQQEYFIHIAVYTGIPSIVSLLCIIVIALQLLRNNRVEYQLQNNIALVGKSFIVMIVGTVAVPILSFLLNRIEWEEPFYALFFSLPTILMLNLYWNERELLKS